MNIFKTLCFSSLILSGVLLSENSEAQGLKKLKEKAENALNNAASGGSGKASKGDLAEAAADSTDTFLEGKLSEVKSDPFGLGGIWYSRDIVQAESDGDNPMTNQPKAYMVKKFLLSFDEQKSALEIKTRYAYEPKDRTKLVKSAIFSSTPNHINTSLTEGHLALDAAHNSDASKYKYVSYSYKEDLQGNVTKGSVFPENFGSSSIYQWEKDILLIYNNSITEYTSKKDVEKAKFKGFIVLYKPESEKRANEITSEQVFEFFKDYTKRLEEAGKRTDNGKALPAPGSTNTHATFKETISKSLAVASERLKAINLGHFKPVYVYSIHNSPNFETLTRMENLTKVACGRRLPIIVVCENTAPVKEDSDLDRGFYTKVKNKYVYFVTYADEMMKDDKSNISEYSGKIIINTMQGPWPVAENEDAMKYKK